jgi:hypothetical protein
MAPIDVFRTNRKDTNISDVSSYLDLAPLYGSSQEEQDSIRTFKDGLILPDTFAEKRLLGLPPGICVLLVMYSRFHNYAATTLKAINEGGRFSLPRDPDEAALKKQDNDLFQVARLLVVNAQTIPKSTTLTNLLPIRVTNGLYVNISIHE